MLSATVIMQIFQWEIVSIIYYNFMIITEILTFPNVLHSSVLISDFQNSHT